MDREEILELNRKDNKGSDEYETHVLGRASVIATLVGGLFCIAFTLLEFLITKHFTCSYWAIYFGILFTEFLIKAIKLKRKSLILFSIFYGVLMLGTTVYYILKITEAIQ